MGTILGLDIGGANLKAVHTAGVARVQPFALWREPEQLPAALGALIQPMPAFDQIAVTMTGELCDCFATKRAGVHTILDAVEQAARGKAIQVWGTDGRFHSASVARQHPLLVAAANWLALAQYAGRFAAPGPAILIDIGSTTTDIIPLLDGKPVPQGRTDTARLESGELVYTGVLRTPLCALLGSAVMAEVFATTLDAYLLLGDLPENLDAPTADGRAATRAHAHSRMARMLGGDGETCSTDETMGLARRAAAAQQAILRHALHRVTRTLPAAPVRFIVSGSGEFLARRVLGAAHISEEKVFSLSQHLGPLVSTAACAHAVVVLAGEMNHA
jgi:probable H4MPT-linked C1 transfer pathway protein